MPLYDYICENGHIVEVMHGVNDSGPEKCDRCGAEMRKLLSTPAIVFKGSGWAKKDRSSKPSAKEKPATDSEAKPKAATDGQSAKSDTTTGTASSDSKPSA